MKEYFPRLPILVLLDGLYPNGPVVELCRLYHWQFMIVLQDKSMPSVWEEIAPDSAQPVQKASRHAWISSEALSRQNVHERSNLGARHRWGIESNFLVEKCHGYQYEHCFSHDWKAMKGYHFLLRLGHLLNTLAQKKPRLAPLAFRRGRRGDLQFLSSA